jgi:O-antigen ligase
LALRTPPQAGSPLSEPRPTGFLSRLSSPGAAVFALLVPLVFIHIRYQPTWEIDVGSTDVGVGLSDLAVLACGLTGLAVGIKLGFGPLQNAFPIVVAAAVFLALVLGATVYGSEIGEEYAFGTHLVTASQFGEYALLGLAAPLVLRSAEDVVPLLATLTVWSVAASGGAVLQFLGVIDEERGRQPGQREPSFLGYHDLAALSGATLAIALATIALSSPRARERILPAVAGVAGSVGLVLSGALAGFVGIVAAGGAVAVLAGRRGTLTVARAAALAAVISLVGAGLLVLRSANISAFLRFVGIEPAQETETFAGESYVQRLVLGYIGIRIFLDHPLLGAGWQATSEEETYGPYLADARRRYPDARPEMFPSPDHPWGVQNAYIQTAGELGVIGLASFLVLLASGLAVGARAAARAPPEIAATTALPVLWLLVTMGVWLGLGLVAGIPLAGLFWLTLGLAAAAPSWARGYPPG